MKKILVVEDDIELAENISDILILHGYIVSVVSNGERGKQLLFRYHPDLIISDVLMPGMNGIEFVRSIRKEPLHRNTPIIFFSAKVADDDVQKGKDAGANLYLKKPFDTDMLVESVSKLLA